MPWADQNGLRPAAARSSMGINQEPNRCPVGAPLVAFGNCPCRSRRFMVSTDTEQACAASWTPRWSFIVGHHVDSYSTVHTPPTWRQSRHVSRDHRTGCTCTAGKPACTSARPITRCISAAFGAISGRSAAAKRSKSLEKSRVRAFTIMEMIVVVALLRTLLHQS